MTIHHSDDWQPTVSQAVLRARAKLLADIRNFMQSQNILEVETPLLVNHPVSEANIDSFSTVLDHPGDAKQRRLYLHTSPEYAMKRLLAAGNGAIYQICKVFRNNESGSQHNPEFTMLEWYQPEVDQHGLMESLNRLLEALGFPTAVKKSYTDIFYSKSKLDPHTASLDELLDFATEQGFHGETKDRSTLLDYIFSHTVMPELGLGQPEMVHDFPACQAALSRLSKTNPVVAERFELFIQGKEIANGFHELTDANEQRQRFHDDNSRRKVLGKPTMEVDEYFLSALESGLPACAGLALGIDRLLMVMYQCHHIDEVLAFPVERA